MLGTKLSLHRRQPRLRRQNLVHAANHREQDCHAVVRASREIASAENSLVIEGSDATLVTSALRFAAEHVLRIRDPKGTSEERFPASPNYELEVLAFEGEARGTRSLLPSGEEALHVVATTQAVLASVAERRAVTVQD